MKLHLLKFEKNQMNENFQDYKISIKVALENAKKRINLLDNPDKKSVLDEYKEWIKDDFGNHKAHFLEMTQSLNII